MNDFDEFDKKFDRQFRQFDLIGRMGIAWFVFVALLALFFACGGAFVIYKVLAHFGIL